MATVNKDFKIKQGLIVEGTTATVNGYDLLKKSAADDEYIIGLIGGTATSANTPNTVVKRDGDGKFTATEITADLIGSVTGQVSDISNHSTSNLTEGTRLYFTNQRALDATASAYDVSGSAATAYTDATTFATSADTALYGTVTTDIATAKSAAISDAAADATSKANAAQSAAASDATTKANAAETAAQNAAAADATFKANAAQAAAEATASADATSKANTAQSAAASDATTKANAAQSAAASDATTKANAAETAAKAYTDSEVSALVDSAPELLDTLNELAAAISDNPNYASDVANLVATKADTSYVNSEIRDLEEVAQVYASLAQSAAAADATSKANAAQSAAAADATLKADAAELSASNYTNVEIIDALNTAQGYASAAQDAAQAAASDDARARVNALESSLGTYIFNSEAAITTAYKAYADTAQTDAETFATTAIDALDTDDIEEGSVNQYFLDSRAKTSAADLLIGANKNNITITGSGSGLTITAENGVADSDTDDLTEGSTNLYFTDARAVSALEAVVPNFTAVELNSVAKQVAATLEAATAGVQTAYAFAKSEYRSAEFLVKVAYGTHTEISKVLLTLDTSDNIALTEYGIVGTNGSASTVSAGISGTNVTLLVTTNNNNSTVTVMGTLLV